jgi:hypothetical protein
VARTLNKEKRIQKLKEIPKGKMECTKCKKIYPTSHFGWVRRGEAGTYNINTRVCRTCVNKNASIVHQLKKIYPYPKHSKCDCCSKKAKLHLDHNYSNQKFRGWLCSECNTGIGKLGDNIVGLKRALRYLLKANELKQIPIKRTNASIHNKQKIK